MSDIRHNLGGKFERRETMMPTGPFSYFVGGDGPPFLHIHGAGGLRVSNALQELTKSHRVYMPLVPGFDDTVAHEDLNSFPELADMLAGFAETQIGTPCPLNGHAMGGRLVIWYAILHSDKAGKVIIQCPSGLRTQDRTITDAQYTAQVVTHADRVPDENRSPEVVAANRTAGHRYHTPGKDVVQAKFRDQDMIDRLGDITCRALILQGSLDGVLAPDSVEFLAGQVRNSQLVFVEDAGHLIEIDQRESYLKLVRDFLA
ncbi:MAG: alpha/beta hydrolase [Rhodospirillales bacterium]|nr:alpha/beta hydrolase [Rhodospirillales bacterium]